MKHFLEISQLSSEQIESLLQRALYFKHTKRYPSYSQSIIANLFYENSTRTRISFELAERHLGMSVVNLDFRPHQKLKAKPLKIPSER